MSPFLFVLYNKLLEKPSQIYITHTYIHTYTYICRLSTYIYIYKVEKKIQTDYTFIPTSLFRGCPLAGNCLQPCVIYQAAVTRKDNNKKDTYIGLTENNFKTRYRNHTASFRHAKLRNSTELSKHIWTLKDNCIDHFISWRILLSHSPYSSASKRCNLCLREKFLIICQPDLSTLNKRNELVSSCRHRNKALLRNS